jgi:hypothetical protein
MGSNSFGFFLQWDMIVWRQASNRALFSVASPYDAELRHMARSMPINDFTLDLSYLSRSRAIHGSTCATLLALSYVLEKREGNNTHLSDVNPSLTA